MSDSEVTTTRNDHTGRYEGRRGDDLVGVLEFVHRGDTVVFTHVETLPQYEGQGVASAIVRAALDDVRAAGTRVVPQCPYVRTWLDRHPDFQSLIAG